MHIVIPRDIEHVACAAALRYAQAFLHIAKEAEHHRVIRRLRRMRSGVRQKHIDAFNRFSVPAFAQLLKRHLADIQRRHAISPACQFQRERAHAAARVAHMRTFLEPRRDPFAQRLRCRAMPVCPGKERRRFLRPDHKNSSAVIGTSTRPVGVWAKITSTP